MEYLTAQNLAIILEKENSKRQKIALEKVLASFPKRILAWVTDQTIIVGFTFGFVILTSGLSYLSDPGILNSSLPKIWILFNLIYFVFLEGLTGQSLGKILLGIYACEENGDKLGLSSALFRRIGNVTYILLFFVIDGFTILLTSKRQRIFDIVAGTIVVDDDYKEKAPRLLKEGELSEEKPEEELEIDEETKKKKMMIDKLKKKKNQLKSLFEDEEIDEEQYSKLTKKYDSKIESLNEEIEIEDS